MGYACKQNKYIREIFLMKFWDNETEQLVKNYCLKRKSPETVINLLKINPHIFKYIVTTMDSCIGMHQVYMVTFINKSLRGMVKVGYTKHKNLRKRFSESRYKGDKLIVDEIILQVELPALGAINFEKFIQSKIKNDLLDEKIKIPGKGEFYHNSKSNQILELWKNNVDNYKDVWGIKSPN